MRRNNEEGAKVVGDKNCQILFKKSILVYDIVESAEEVYGGRSPRRIAVRPPSLSQRCFSHQASSATEEASSERGSSRSRGYSGSSYTHTAQAVVNAVANVVVPESGSS